MDNIETIFEKIKAELHTKEDIEQFYKNMLSFYENQQNENNKNKVCGEGTIWDKIKKMSVGKE